MVTKLDKESRKQSLEFTVNVNNMNHEQLINHFTQMTDEQLRNIMEHEYYRKDRIRKLALESFNRK